MNKFERLALGKVLLTWTSILGEKGSLGYGALAYIPESHSEIEVSVIQSPDELKVEQPVWVKCQLINRSSRPMEIQLYIEKQSQGIAVHGLSHFKLGVVNANYKMEFSALLFPQFVGVQPLSAIRALDISTNKSHDLGSVHDFIVTSDSPLL